MIGRYSRVWTSFWSRNYKYLLVGSWVAGLLTGQFLLMRADASVHIMLHSAVLQPASLAGLLVAAVIPFVFAAIVVSFSRPWMLVLLCFARSLMFSYIVLGIAVSFGDACWLIRWLFLFSRFVTASLEYWYWHRCIAKGCGFDVVFFMFLLSIIFLVVSFDYCIVMPFGACFLDLMKG